MSRNIMVLFLLVAVVCTAILSNHRATAEPLPGNDCYESTTRRHYPPTTRWPHPPTTRWPQPPPPRCPPNEIYNRCGTACQPSCNNRKPICNLRCVAGCFCRNGQLRNRWGKCVEPCDC